MTCSDKLEILSGRLTFMQNPCSRCLFTQQELMALLNEFGGDLDKASYHGCLRLAECSALTTPETKTESQREYWLSMARLYRPNRTGSVRRMDGEGER